jgi:hypothetical protein
MSTESPSSAPSGYPPVPEPTTPKSPSRGTPAAPPVSMDVGPRPDPPSVVVTVPAGYDDPPGTLQVEVSDPHRVGEGMSKHVEYKVTYWTTLPSYERASGCVTRRYSDFEWLWKMLRASSDGIIVPAPPPKTLVPNDDPTSAAIEARRATLAQFVARVAAHPVLSASPDVRVFLEEQNKTSWAERVPWYERGVTSDAIKGVSDWFTNTVRLDDTGTAAVLLQGAAEAAYAARDATVAAATGKGGAAASSDRGLPGASRVEREGSLREKDLASGNAAGAMPAIITGEAASLPPGLALPTSPTKQGPGAAAPPDGVVESQHFLEVAEYVTNLKGRVEKLLVATSALVKHSRHTSAVMMQFASVVGDLAEAEAKATEGAIFAAGDDAEGGQRAIRWTEAAELFASASAPPRVQAEEVHAAFYEPLEAAAQLCQACVGACDTRKAIVDHYNRLCRQIDRLDQKAAAMGVPEPGPKREEKQKVELAASDLRIARTQAMAQYERCVERVERELLWFHTELAKAMGAALQSLVAAQGAAAGRAAHACAGHFEEIANIMASKPSAFVGGGE